MSTTSQPTTFADMYGDLQARVRSDTSVTATTNIAKRYVNIGLFDMHIGGSERFPWAERDAVLVTHPRVSWAGTQSGGITATQGSEQVEFTLAGSQLPVAANNDYGQPNIRNGGLVRVSGTSETYRLSNVLQGVSSSLADLSSVYIDDDTSAEEAFEYWEDEYDLASDFLRPVDASRFSYGRTPIKLIGRTQFRNLYPKNDVFGSPYVATLIDRPSDGDTDPVRRIRLHPVPDAVHRIGYSYITSNLAVSSAGVAQTQLVEDDDEPIVPLRYRMLPVLHGLYCWYRDRSDDQRSREAKAEYDSLLARISGDTEVGQSRPRFGPARASYVRKSRRPWRTGTRRFDLGEFDYGGE